MPYFTVKNIRIFYNERGKGKPLAIFHGNGGSSKMLKTEIKYYAKYFRVLAFDLPGHGRSDRISGFEGDFWQYSAFLVKKVLQGIGVKELYLMGSSGGAIVAFHLAMDPDLKPLSVIADSFEGLALPPERAKALVNQRNNTMNLRFFKMFFKYLHGHDWRDVLNKDSKNLLHFAEHKTAWFDSLEEVDCPVLLTALESDDMIPRAAEKVKLVHDILPNSELHILSKGKHPAMLSNKKQYRKIVCNFCCPKK
jgi:pimeloyl-ACP methyl ester carboxylesterase